MTIKPRFGFALENVPDIKAAKRFYIEVLGLEVEREAPSYIQFKDQVGASYAIACDEAISAERLELYWLVDDAEASLAELSQKTEIIMPLRQLPFGKVFGIKDPAGQPQYLLEFAKKRPSRQL
jgi:predicted enzyme related to lactoylglutathione lyase